MSTIERRYIGDAEPFCSGDDRSVCGAEGKVSILRDKFCDPHPITGVDVFSEEVACGEVAEKANFGIGAQTSADEVGDFGDDECRDDERTWVSFEQV